MSGLVVNEVQCRSIMNRSRIPGIDYTINPYTGCVHGCVYCYARFMTRYTKHTGAWGSFVDIKVNAVEIITAQSAKAKPGNVSLSTVTDPYQALEKKYVLTRRILEILGERGFPVSILTKSDLVLRDMDILRRFPGEDCEVGFSLSSMDESAGRSFEPNAPPVSRRMEALRKLHGEGVRTWAFLAPVLPFVTEHTLEPLVNALRGNVNYLLVDSMNMKKDTWSAVSKVLAKEYPSEVTRWRKVLFDRDEKERYHSLFFRTLSDLCKHYNVELHFC